MTFNDFCDIRKILYFREAFFQHLMEIGFKGETEAEYDAAWRVYLDKRIKDILQKP